MAYFPCHSYVIKVSIGVVHTLFLVEKSKDIKAIPFTKEEMNKIFDDTKDQIMMDQEVYIAGVGAITAIGNNVAECLSSLEKEQALHL